MKLFTTEIQAIDPLTGEMKTWQGDNIAAPTFELAAEWCRNNKGYLKVIGELIAEIPAKSDGITPDFDNMIDYETIQKN